MGLSAPDWEVITVNTPKVSLLNILLHAVLKSIPSANVVRDVVAMPYCCTSQHSYMCGA